MKTLRFPLLPATCIVAGLAAATTPVTHAQEIPAPTTHAAPSRVALVLEGGTTGVGPSLIFTVNPKLSVTVGYTWLNTDYDTDSHDANYDGKLKLSNFKAVANWHPWSGTFHFSGGVYVADNKVDVTARPKNGTTYELNGHFYDQNDIDSITGQADFEGDVAPYIGVGWAKNPARGGWGFYADLGVFFAGDASARLSATGPATITPQFQNDLRSEENDINDDLNDLAVYPVAQIGVMYRF